MDNAIISKLRDRINSASNKAPKKPAAKKARAKKANQPRQKLRERFIFAPTSSHVSRATVIWGYICRMLVIYAGVLGMSVFIEDALKSWETVEGMGIPFLMVVSLIAVTLFGIAAINRITFWTVGGATVAGAAIYVLAQPAPATYLAKVGTAFFNHVVDRLVSVGYTTLAESRIADEAFAADAVYPSEFIFAAYTILVFLLAALFVATLARRVRLLPLLVVCLSFVCSIFMYNITRTNTGIAILLAALLGIIVFKDYDLYYVGSVTASAFPDEKEKDDSAVSEKQPKIKRDKAERQAERLERAARVKAEKEEKARVRKAEKEAAAKGIKLPKQKKVKKTREPRHVVVRDISSVLTTEVAVTENDGYTPPPKPVVKTVTLPNGRTKKVKEKKAPMSFAEMMRFLKYKADNAGSEKSREEREERKKNNLASAVGGFAGLAATALSLLVIWLPAATTDSYFQPVDFINEKMSIARMYVTAYLLGDDVDLNNLSLYGGLSDFSARNTDFDSPVYTGIKLLTIDTSYDTPVYLRAWIGTDYDYEEGTWYSADNDDIIAFRKKFGTGYSPDEIMTDFYKAVLPSATDVNRYDTYKNYIQNGFFIMQLNITRINGNGYLLYMPSFINTDAGVLEFDSKESATFKNTCYFDGIYTSRLFMPGEQYSTLSYVTSMRYENVGYSFLNNTVYYAYSNIYLDQLDYLLEQYPVYDVTSAENDTVLSAVFENFVSDYEREMQLCGITWRGDSILRRYIQMDADSRKSYKKAVAVELKYRDYAVDTYVSTTKMANIRRMASELCGVDFDEDPWALEKRYETLNSVILELNKYAKDIAAAVSDGDMEYGTQFIAYDFPNVNEVLSGTTLHDVVINVVNYLADNYTYTLTPAAPLTEDGEVDESVRSLDAFLFDTKEGYCVHFATAAIVLLREMGIPARFAEGYLASDFWRNYAEDAPSRYRINIYDYNAHAWLEVYYPGMGWMQYEATPPYMSGMYEALVTESTTYTPSTQSYAATPHTENEEVVIGDLEAERAELIKVIVLWSLLGLAVLAIIITTIVLIARMNKKADKAVLDRQLLISNAKRESDFEKDSAETRSLSKRIIDQIFAIYEGIGVPPVTGELPTQYASRIAAEYVNLSKHNINDVIQIIEKEEFGYGLNFRELYTLADYLNDITHSIYSGMNRRERFRMRYIRRLL